MEDGTYWRSRASEMRERAAQIRDPFISGGFRALAEQYEQLAESGVRWMRPDCETASRESPQDLAQRPEHPALADTLRP
jgi:hypothetical protein